MGSAGSGSFGNYRLGNDMSNASGGLGSNGGNGEEEIISKIIGKH